MTRERFTDQSSLLVVEAISVDETEVTARNDIEDFFASEFGEGILPTLLIDTESVTNETQQQLQSQGIQVEAVENLEVFDSIQELQADLQTKIQQNRGLTDALGAIGSMFGGCGHLLHLHGAEGLGGHVHGMAGSSSARSSTENSFFPSSPLNSSIQRAWAQSGGDIFIFEKLLMSFLPQIRLFLDSVVTLSSGLVMVGPKNSISLNQALPFAA